MNVENIKKALEARLNSIEDAYKETGRPKVDFSVYPEDMREHEEACYDAKIIVEAARKIECENGSGEIDWDNYDQLKWINWFVMSPSGFRFDLSFFDGSTALAGSGSRLRVLSKEASDHIGIKFIDIWKKVQLK